MQINGKVPMFKMKPHRGFLIMGILVLFLGLLFFWKGHMDPGDIDMASRSNLVLTISIAIAGALFILATGRMWFKHLWHDRYDRNGKLRDRGRPRAKQYR